MRVLVTGVSHAVGGAVARRLEDFPDVEAIFGLDIDDPRVALDRTEFVHADIRHSLLTKLVRRLEVDVVVHCAVLIETRASGRAVHETNVIGTMNLCAACSGAGSPVRRLVMRSGVAVYGCDPTFPSFLGEHMAERAPGEGLGRELFEAEQMARDFAVRHPDRAVTILRLGHRLGLGEPTPLGSYLLGATWPTFAGFDPRIQFLHEDDAVEAIVRAAMADHHGQFNVAGPGVLLLSQAAVIAGRTRRPVLPVFARGAARAALRLTGVDAPPWMLDLIAFGSVVDCSAIEREFGWRPARSTRETLEEFVATGGAPKERSLGPQEYELSTYLQRRRKAGRPVHVVK